jgi:hypothetical protein
LALHQHAKTPGWCNPKAHFALTIAGGLYGFAVYKPVNIEFDDVKDAANLASKACRWLMVLWFLIILSACSLMTGGTTVSGG